MSRTPGTGPAALAAGPAHSSAAPAEPVSPASEATIHPLPCPDTASCGDGSREAREACRRERSRLEANKAAAERLLQMFDNPVLARREYNRYVRDLNASIRAHNAVCKASPISLLPI